MLGRGYQEPLRGQRPPNHFVGVSSKDSRPRVQGWVVVLGLLPPGPFWSSLEKLGGGVVWGTSRPILGPQLQVFRKRSNPKSEYTKDVLILRMELSSQEMSTDVLENTPWVT